jgi:hypothetical protein
MEPVPMKPKRVIFFPVNAVVIRRSLPEQQAVLDSACDAGRDRPERPDKKRAGIPRQKW